MTQFYAAVICLMLAATPFSAQAQDMTPERMGEIIALYGTDIEAGDNFWRFQLEGVYLICVYDAIYDRMRLVAPIIEITDLTDEQRDLMLEANFHSALDARYATSDGVVYAAYIHPLSPLTDAQFESAIEQVAVLTATFGDTYTSGALSFGDQEE